MKNDRNALSCLALLIGQIFVPSVAMLVALPAHSVQAQSADAPALMLPQIWQAGASPVGFLVSEKLDGVRAFWDGSRLRFRSGLPIAAPDWFTAGLPKVALDGELWLGRGQFDRLSGMVRSVVPQDADWRELRYMVFDLPGAAGSFAKRFSDLQTVVQSAGLPWLKAVAQSPSASVADLQTQLTQLVAAGGEGLVLHRADALWTPGRSDAVWKFKPVQDEDARVVAHLPGKGRNAGRLGALLLELPDGQRFALGTGLTDVQRQLPPALGSVVTYRFRGHTPKGLPRFASFLRVRGPE